ncbi:phenylacetaldehyde dehydrogenase [Actinorhabdospora filicis]|uniref:Phenylacetaldehyde dehydrogenase n=1 Tax=Actinorhabdospora filicis TaxID=1785913 RepID=A0A9W6SIY4_9ACTN|nr:aldehyde dehydrogenase family protein [Actinorhabdospora filicis]GLZ76389.1 phenylacetaldehyde dehydrogenase [Actinorhabdospora filicis]
METLPVVDPASEEVIVEVAAASASDVDLAVADAVKVAAAWRAVAPGERARLLRRFAALVEEHAEELARLESRQAGHPITAARWEAGNVADVLNYYAGAPERHTGRQIPVPGGLDVTFHEPLGVVGVIVPWNFPMVITMWGVAPALAAGNAVIVKPAESTPLTAVRLEALALEAGLPEGVLQVLPGRGEVAGAALAAHPDVRKIVFTGSVAVGREIARTAAATIKRVTLELGGNSANIVFADADLALAAAKAPGAVFDNAGQDCCARSRILVQREVYDEFLALLEPAVRAVRVGDPGDEGTEMGPLISGGHRDRVAAYLTREPDFAGTCPSGPGFWLPPAAYVDVAADDPLWTEEVFGPVVAVAPFDGEADAIAKANATPYGLSGSIWTRDTGRALRMARAVEAGNLSVNSNSSVRYWTPFGGVKQSGLGRELGPDALDAFCDTKNVFIATEE